MKKAESALLPASRGVAFGGQEARPEGDFSAQPTKGVKVQAAGVQASNSLTISPLGRWVFHQPEKECLWTFVRQTARLVWGLWASISDFLATQKTPWLSRVLLIGRLRLTSETRWLVRLKSELGNFTATSDFLLKHYALTG